MGLDWKILNSVGSEGRGRLDCEMLKGAGSKGEMGIEQAGY